MQDYWGKERALPFVNVTQEKGEGEERYDDRNIGHPLLRGIVETGKAKGSDEDGRFHSQMLADE
jgi:hypothetical protein